MMQEKVLQVMRVLARCVVAFTFARPASDAGPQYRVVELTPDRTRLRDTQGGPRRAHRDNGVVFSDRRET
jgi:hypothetical protein